jgi:hypothetical protein
MNDTAAIPQALALALNPQEQVVVLSIAGTKLVRWQGRTEYYRHE